LELGGEVTAKVGPGCWGAFTALILRSEAKPRVSKDDPEGVGFGVSWSVLRDAAARLFTPKSRRRDLGAQRVGAAGGR
jgi:hypothetical protein